MTRLYCIIAVGVIGMFLLALSRHKKYELSRMHTALITLSLVISGFLGIKVLYYIEAGAWNGMSFYGAIFMVPFFLVFIKRICKKPYIRLLDFSAPAGCMMLGVMKINCLMSKCCSGIDLYKLSNGKYVGFPSQKVELAVAFFIMFILLYLESNKYCEGKRYAVFMLVYGSFRFVLNFFRYGLTPFVWIIPAGHFWSLVSIGIGITWIIIDKSNKRRKDGN